MFWFSVLNCKGNMIASPLKVNLLFFLFLLPLHRPNRRSKFKHRISERPRGCKNIVFSCLLQKELFEQAFVCTSIIYNQFPHISLACFFFSYYVTLCSVHVWRSLVFICYRFIVCGALGNIVHLAAAQYSHRAPLLCSEPPPGAKCLAKWLLHEGNLSRTFCNVWCHLD